MHPFVKFHIFLVQTVYWQKITKFPKFTEAVVNLKNVFTVFFFPIFVLIQYSVKRERRKKGKLIFLSMCILIPISSFWKQHDLNYYSGIEVFGYFLPVPRRRWSVQAEWSRIKCLAAGCRCLPQLLFNCASFKCLIVCSLYGHIHTMSYALSSSWWGPQNEPTVTRQGNTHLFLNFLKINIFFSFL